MRFLLKTVALIVSSILYGTTCTVLTAWLYRMGPAEDVLHWHSWVAAIEMATIMTGLSAPWWISAFFFRRPIRPWGIGIGTTVLSAVSTGCYIWFIFRLGPDNPLLTIFGDAAAGLFREDAGIVYAVIVAPTMAILSGVFCWIMLALIRKGGPKNPAVPHP